MTLKHLSVRIAEHTSILYFREILFKCICVYNFCFALQSAHDFCMTDRIL